MRRSTQLLPRPNGGFEMEPVSQHAYVIRSGIVFGQVNEYTDNPEGWGGRATMERRTPVVASSGSRNLTWWHITLLCIILALSWVSRIDAASVQILGSYTYGGCNARCVVRSASGNIYAVILDEPSAPTGTVRVFESTDGGASWTQQDAADAPSGNYWGQSAAIDGNGIIHIAYWDRSSTSPGLRYVMFSTATNTFSGDTAVVSTQTQGSTVALAIDSNNYEHIIYNDDVNGLLVVTYIDNVGGSWNTPVQVYSETQVQGSPAGGRDILIDENNLPEITYWDSSSNVHAAIGSANKATSFTNQLLAPSDWLGGGSITMDSLGNTWILYDTYTSPYTPTLIEHKAGDPWSTWQQPVVDPDPSSEGAAFGSVAALGTTIYVTWQNSGPTNIPGAWQAYNGSEWSTLGTFSPAGDPLMLGWSEYFNNLGSSHLDVIMSGGFIYWAELTSAVFNTSLTCAPAGTTVNITGYGFGDTQGTSTLTFNGTPATVSTWSNTEIAATVPSGITSGPIVVSVELGVSNPIDFAAPSTAQPQISSVTPDLGNIGGTVVINGQNLCTASVTFNGISASPSGWNTDQQIIAPVPTGATTGPVTATVNSLSSNPFMFTVLGAMNGTVTSAGNGSPISGGTVQAIQSNNIIGSATTAADGTYAIANLVPGSYDVRFYATGFGSSIVSGSVVGSGAITTVNGLLGSPGTISGKVTETDGVTPIVGASVTAAQGSNSFGSSTTDSNGDYSIATLSPGTYNVIAAETGFATEISSGVAVTAGNTTTANLSLPVQSASSVTYSYDALGRLTRASVPTSNPAYYTYDAVGNLLSVTVVSISGFSPTSGKVGTSVTITGTGFSATLSQDTVYFNGTVASITSATTTQIVTAVPRGATTGPITVYAPDGSATSSSSFTVTKH